MKKLLIIAVAIVCVLLVSCDADSIQKTSKGLQGMSALNLAADDVKEDTLNFIKDSVIPGIREDINPEKDIKDEVFPEASYEEKAELLRYFFYINALAVNDVDQREQEGKLRQALAGTLCGNSLSGELDFTFTAVLNVLINQIDNASLHEDAINNVKDVLESMGVDTSSIQNLPIQLTRIRKIVKAVLPAAAGFDTVKARIYGKTTCTYADYMTYWMSVMMMNEVASFIVNGDTSLVSLLDSTECDRILAYIHAIEVINNVDFDFPAIVSGLTS